MNTVSLRTECIYSPLPIHSSYEMKYNLYAHTVEGRGFVEAEGTAGEDQAE